MRKQPTPKAKPAPAEPLKPPEPPQEAPAGKSEGAKATEKATPPTSDIPSTTEALMTWVCEAKAFRTVKTAREWLINVCKITSQRLTEDPAGVYQEVKQLLGK